MKRPKRFYVAASAVFLFCLSIGAGIAATVQQDELLTRQLDEKVYAFGIYLGGDPDMLYRLTVFSKVVMDVSQFSKAEVQLVTDTGTKVYAYLPVASITTGTDEHKTYKEDKLAAVPHTDSTYYVNPKKKWRKYIVQEIAAAAKNKGVHGFYIADLKIYSDVDSDIQEEVAQNVRLIIKQLDKTYPKKKKIVEDVFSISDSAAFQRKKWKKYINGISKTEVNYKPKYSASDGGRDTYKKQTKKKRKRLVSKLKSYQKRGKRTYTVDYTQSESRKSTAELRAENNGFIAVVGTRDMEDVLWYGGRDSSVETRPFQPDSIWNTPIADPVVDELSDQMIDTLRDGHSDNKIYVNVDEWAVPMYYADASTPIQSVPCDNCGPGFTGEVPIPDHAQADPTEDGLLTIIDVVNKRGYDLYQATYGEGGWAATSGFSFDLTGSGIQEISSTSTSCRGSGFPLAAGIIRRDEILQGYIAHALVMAIDYPRQDVFVWPASATDGRSDEEHAIPEGAHIQLNPKLDIEDLGLSRSGEIIARALQEYGAYISDNADGIALYAEGRYAKDPGWGKMMGAEEVIEIPLDELRVLELGELQTNPYLTATKAVFK